MVHGWDSLFTTSDEILRKKTLDSTCDVSAAVGGSGTTETASNLGAGQGWYKTKVGVDLQFRSLTATSSKIALANNTNDVGIDVTEANLTHDNIGGTLGIAKGGTGATTATAAFDALSPMTTLGAVIYGGASGTRTALTGNTSLTRKVLSQVGTGSASAAPLWDLNQVFPSSQRPTGVWTGRGGLVGEGKLANVAVGGGAGGSSTASSAYADGVFTRFDTGATITTIWGLRSNATILFRGWNPRLKCKFRLTQLTACKIYIGFRPAAAIPTTDDPNNASSCAMWGFSSTVNATNWITWTNDGSGATETTDTTVAADANIHTIEIWGIDASAKFTYSLDGGAAVDMVSTIPAQTTGLGACVGIVNTTGASKTMDCYYVEVEADK